VISLVVSGKRACPLRYGSAWSIEQKRILTLELARYERILTRIDKKLGPKMSLTAKEILEFLSCTRRSPRLAEISHAITIRANDTCFSGDRILMRSLLEICGPILEIRDGFVYWVHFTAKE
jgi:hypothetical protein